MAHQDVGRLNRCSVEEAMEVVGDVPAGARGECGIALVDTGPVIAERG
jgi:hypothetical protein